ncbi:MAG: YlxR family protein [Anaerolineae bacterium]|nr:YlxR family protein [Anaerolineae bacterium]
MVRSGGRRKHIPQRTCVACRAVRPKRALIRIVRTPQGEVRVDERGKQSGRGAYLCAQRVCWEEALKRHRLDTALRVALDEATVEALWAYAQSLPERLEETDAQ